MRSIRDIRGLIRRGGATSQPNRSIHSVVASTLLGVLAGAGLTAQATDVTVQPLPQNAPNYMRSTYQAALSAPLPIPLSFGSPHFMLPLQPYPNAKGVLGVYQTNGLFTPSSNAFFQSLGTNGRTCFSCHQPASGMSLSTSNIRFAYLATGGRDPMFAPVDGANCPNSVPRNETVISWIGGLLGGGQQSSKNAHSLLLNKGLFRIFLPVPTQTQDQTVAGGPASHPVEFKISVVSDPYGCNTDPNYAKQVDKTTQEVRQMISVYRRPRMSANLKFMTTPALTLGGGGLPNIDFVTGVPVVDPATGAQISGNIMWDGREPTLESQARNATLGHAQALKPPTDAQVAQMVAFETSVYAAQSYHWSAGGLTSDLGANATGGPVPIAKAANSIGKFNQYSAWPTTPSTAAPANRQARASIARGQAIFNTRQMTIGNVAGFNNTPLLGTANPTSNTCASCHGAMPTGSDPFPAGQRDIGIGGHAAAFGGPQPSADLPIFKVTCIAPFVTPYNGSSVLTNDPGQALITGRCADIGRRSVPQLRAMAARDPYFSDGSAPTLDAVVRFYDKRFNIGFTAAEIADLTHFLEAL